MTVYDPPFFDAIREGCQRSAAVVVPHVLKHLQPKTVVDVGGGEGWWAQAFQGAGADVLVLDGEGTAAVVPYISCDLAEHLPEVGTFDLAVCLEVAEHLPPERAASFIADLCRLAPVVLFSAAIPGQGGHHHVNEQPVGYWADLFAGEGYGCSGALRWPIWDDDSVENWYRQNLLVAARDPENLPGLFDTPLAPPWPVVHPVLFDARRA